MEGFKVSSVSTGAAALEQLSILPIDRVLFDVMMPNLTGFEVCEKIKANPDTHLIPVVLITALFDKQDRIEGTEVGPDDFLMRPVDRTELLARARSLLTLKFQTDELERAESVPIIRHHHENFDGSGYPDGLAEEALPILARVLQLVDVYDALTTIETYRPAFSITDALQIMQMEVAKGGWDPHIFSLFEQFVRSGTADFLSRGAGAGSNT